MMATGGTVPSMDGPAAQGAGPSMPFNSSMPKPGLPSKSGSMMMGGFGEGMAPGGPSMPKVPSFPGKGGSMDGGFGPPPGGPGKGADGAPLLGGATIPFTGPLLDQEGQLLGGATIPFTPEAMMAKAGAVPVRSQPSVPNEQVEGMAGVTLPKGQMGYMPSKAGPPSKSGPPGEGEQADSKVPTFSMPPKGEAFRSKSGPPGKGEHWDDDVPSFSMPPKGAPSKGGPPGKGEHQDDDGPFFGMPQKGGPPPSKSGHFGKGEYWDDDGQKGSPPPSKGGKPAHWEQADSDNAGPQKKAWLPKKGGPPPQREQSEGDAPSNATPPKRLLPRKGGSKGSDVGERADDSSPYPGRAAMPKVEGEGGPPQPKKILPRPLDHDLPFAPKSKGGLPGRAEQRVDSDIMAASTTKAASKSMGSFGGDDAPYGMTTPKLPAKMPLAPPKRSGGGWGEYMDSESMAAMHPKGGPGRRDGDGMAHLKGPPGYKGGHEQMDRDIMSVASSKAAPMYRM